MMKNKYKKELNLRKKKLIKYIKTNYKEYDGEMAFLDINRMLLENYIEYYSLKHNVTNSSECCEEIIKQLKEALTIVNRIDIDEYDTEAVAWLEKHNKTICSLYNPKTCKTIMLGEAELFKEKDLVDAYIKEHSEAKHWLHSCQGVWDSEENKYIWDNLMARAEKEKSKDFNDFFNCIAKNCRNWWD